MTGGHLSGIDARQMEFSRVHIGAMIRDNLTLNVVMFLWPLDNILEWQKGR